MPLNGTAEAVPFPNPTCLTSSVTRVATDDVQRAAHLIFLNQIFAQSGLIGIPLSIYYDWMRTRGLLVAHVENLRSRPQILFRGAVAI
jgi:hypothetical protein